MSLQALINVSGTCQAYRYSLMCSCQVEALCALGWNSWPSDSVMLLLEGSRRFLSAKMALPCVHS